MFGHSGEIQGVSEDGERDVRNGQRANDLAGGKRVAEDQRHHGSNKIDHNPLEIDYRKETEKNR